MPRLWREARSPTAPACATGPNVRCLRNHNIPAGPTPHPLLCALVNCRAGFSALVHFSLLAPGGPGHPLPYSPPRAGPYLGPALRVGAPPVPGRFGGCEPRGGTRRRCQRSRTRWASSCWKCSGSSPRPTPPSGSPRRGAARAPGGGGVRGWVGVYGRGWVGGRGGGAGCLSQTRALQALAVPVIPSAPWRDTCHCRCLSPSSDPPNPMSFPFTLPPSIRPSVPPSPPRLSLSPPHSSLSVCLSVCLSAPPPLLSL